MASLTLVFFHPLELLSSVAGHLSSLSAIRTTFLKLPVVFFCLLGSTPNSIGKLLFSQRHQLFPVVFAAQIDELEQFFSNALCLTDFVEMFLSVLCAYSGLFLHEPLLIFHSLLNGAEPYSLLTASSSVKDFPLLDLALLLKLYCGDDLLSELVPLLPILLFLLPHQL